MRNKNQLWICLTLTAALILTAGLVFALAWMNPITVAQVKTAQAASQLAEKIAAEEAAQQATLPRTITVVGEGTAKIKPDIARANIGVETTGVTVKEATSSAASLMEALLAAIKGQGVAEKDIQTAGYNVWADRAPGPEGSSAEKLTYRVNNSLSVTIRDLSKVGAVLDAAIEAGANSIQGVTFSVAEPKKLLTEARGQAVADALAKANELAGLNGVEVGLVISISEVVGGGGYYPRPVAALEAPKMAALGGGIGPLNPGELELSVQMQIVYAIQ